jgi:hypothetical protein
LRCKGQANLEFRPTAERGGRKKALQEHSSDKAVSGAVFEQEITAELPANTQFLSPRLFMNNGATAAAVAYDSSGVYVETDF